MDCMVRGRNNVILCHSTLVVSRNHPLCLPWRTHASSLSSFKSRESIKYVSSTCSVLFQVYEQVECFVLFNNSLTLRPRDLRCLESQWPCSVTPSLCSCITRGRGWRDSKLTVDPIGRGKRNLHSDK